MKLYAEPVNLFVASFLGSPPMNFVHGKLTATSSGLVFRERQEGTIELKFANRPQLQPYVGQELILGIRAENIQVVQAVDKPRGVRFQGVVDMIEPMGAETFYYVQTGAHIVISRTPGSLDHGEAGHRLQFEVDAEKVHFFDPATTLRIQ